MEEEIRKQAIQRFLQRERSKSIYTSLNRSKNWFFKWLKRYQTGQAEWYKEQSRAPHTSPKKIPEQQKETIMQTRYHLEAQHYAQTGVSAIKWELSKQGLKFPSDSTINRVLKREGLVKKNFIYSQGG